MTKCFIVFSASEAERTIGFRQPGYPTVQTEVAHQSNLNMSAGNQVRINIGNSPDIRGGTFSRQALAISKLG